MEPLENGQDERGRLARAGLGAGEQIAALEDEGDRVALDGGGLGVALVRDGAEEFGRQPEDIEGHWKQQLLTGPSRYAAGPGQGVGWIGIGRYWTGALTGAPIEHESRSLLDAETRVEWGEAGYVGCDRMRRAIASAADVADSRSVSMTRSLSGAVPRASWAAK